MAVIRTIDVKQEKGSIVKPGELIEIRRASNLTLQDRRVLNLLYMQAGPRICDDAKHTMAICELRGTHESGDRVKDSIIRLMQTLVELPCIGRNGKPATKRMQLLSDTTTSDDDGDPTGQVVYSFSPEMRALIKNSTTWGKLRSEVVFAFTSKYSLALYELLSKRVNLSKKWQEDFGLADMRALLGVPDNKLQRTPDLLRFVIVPAETEVNGLADFGVKIDAIRAGGQKRGTVTGFRVSWWRKNPDQLRKAYDELQRSKVGRIARIKDEVDVIQVEAKAIAATLRNLPPIRHPLDRKRGGASLRAAENRPRA